MKNITANVDNIEEQVKQKREEKPQVTGSARPSDSMYVSQDVDIVLTEAEKIAKKMNKQEFEFLFVNDGSSDKTL